MDAVGYRSRLLVAFLIFFLFFLILLFRLFYLQILKGEEYARLSATNRIQLQSINPHRGLIYDQKGDLLVDNRPSYDLFIVLSDAKPLNVVLQHLSDLSGIPVDFMQERLKKRRGSRYNPVLIWQDLDRDVVGLLSAKRYELPGVRIEVTPRRHYIYPGLAAHALGYLGEINVQELRKPENAMLRGGDFVGKSGVERGYDVALRGERGGRQVEVNARGQVVQILRTVPAKSGMNLYLAMDKSLQAYAENLMEEHVGAVVAMDPASGKILAMVSSPSFDQNRFVNNISEEEWKALQANPRRPMENKAIQALYPPASVYKIISAMTALEEEAVDENTKFFCGGSLLYGNRDFRCWKRSGHGNLNLMEAITMSCDVYFYHIAQKLGVDKFAWYAWASGLGRRTGIDLEPEDGGLVPTAAWKRKRLDAPWQGGETLSVVIGQGYNLVTCLQTAVMVSAIANGGVLYRPQIVHQIRKPDGELVRDFYPEIRGYLPIKPQNLALIRQGLWKVVNDPSGTAWKMRDEKIAIAGKTGTAQVLSRKSEQEHSSVKPGFEPHAWFVAFAPFEKPEIAVAVIVEHGESGSSLAAPIAVDLVRFYLGAKNGEKPEEAATP
ncbi:penicillin-binding protein 2 [Desulfococcaceae bacterium OttesenSCG-928-F15]|nr:penicillin-binding protein 2 [Desulfococcaceae bacterium OttesenSCG-928-F15]